MSVNRDMKSYILQENKCARSLSGAVKDDWVDVTPIDVAVHKKNAMKTVASEKYIESTHTGLTYYKGIRTDRHRLVKDGTVYLIMDCNSEGRLANLLLKVVR